VALYLKAGNSTNTNNSTSPPQRPLIPQINIPHPSTQPVSPPPLTSSPTSIDPPSFPSQQQTLNLPLPPLRSNSLSSGGTSPSLIQFKLNDTTTCSSPPPFRSWSYPINSSVSSPPSPQLTRTLPSINDQVFLQQQIKHLEQENTALKQKLNQANADKQRIHDLEVEVKLGFIDLNVVCLFINNLKILQNKLLKSLILNQSQQQQQQQQQQQDRKRLNDIDDIDLLKKLKYEDIYEDDSSKKKCRVE
jgi:hypothetical protein